MGRTLVSPTDSHPSVGGASVARTSRGFAEHLGLPYLPVVIESRGAAGAAAGPAPDVASAVALGGSGLRLGYGRNTVVEDLSVVLPTGRVTALIGPNGSGKSTVLRALARLHPLQSGRVDLDGDTDVAELPSRVLATRLTLLSQSKVAPGGVTVGEVVAYGRYPHRSRWGGGDTDGAAVVARVLAMTGVQDLADRPVDQLSGGQMQRVWLASCLAQDTAVLLLDEPTTFLDIRYQVELLDIIRDLADEHGITVGVVLHDLDQAAALADGIVLLDGGRVVAAGTPEDVLTAELLTRTYGIDIDVETDALTGSLRTRARGRHHRRRAVVVST
ncbi:ABC transporter ATP-binding protein [Nakamurella flavida]|uniref:ABC transporter ATP-binding protein n=1 Tax=Nakamurella flavida TaxID=363630 RepID=A0A938YIM3_9ACTN|nr:ABC transporter ATP-binding protein [Nakamurella flavida]MBM9476647.1 ABC transporter ATP-binding protein [Nakamurella flavida]